MPSVRTSRFLLLRSVFVFAVAFRIGLFGGKAANEHRDSMLNSIHLSSRKFCRPFINRLSFNSSCRSSCYCLCASELEDKSARDLSIFFVVVVLVSAMLGMFERSLFLNVVLGF